MLEQTVAPRHGGPVLRSQRREANLEVGCSTPGDAPSHWIYWMPRDLTRKVGGVCTRGEVLDQRAARPGATSRRTTPFSTGRPARLARRTLAKGWMLPKGAHVSHPVSVSDFASHSDVRVRVDVYFHVDPVRPGVRGGGDELLKWRREAPAPSHRRLYRRIVQADFTGGFPRLRPATPKGVRAV